MEIRSLTLNSFNISVISQINTIEHTVVSFFPILETTKHSSETGQIYTKIAFTHDIFR